MTYLSALYTCGTRQMSAMDIWNRRIRVNNYCCVTLLAVMPTVTVLSPHRQHKTPLLSASEWAQELEDRKVWRQRRCENRRWENRRWVQTCYWTSFTNLESRDRWSAEPTAPSLRLFSESHVDSESRNQSLLFFPNRQLFFILTGSVLTCRGCIPEAMMSLIIRAWARFCGSAGSKRGPGRVSSIYWITASCVRVHCH